MRKHFKSFFSTLQILLPEYLGQWFIKIHHIGDRRDKHMNTCIRIGEYCQRVYTPPKSSSPGRVTEWYYISFSVTEL